MKNDTLSLLGNVITIDDERIKSHLDRVVRGNVEETSLLDVEVDRLCNAAALRTQRGTPGYARRPLRAQSADQGWRGTAEGTEASPPDL